MCYLEKRIPATLSTIKNAKGHICALCNKVFSVPHLRRFIIISIVFLTNLGAVIAAGILYTQIQALELWLPWVVIILSGTLYNIYWLFFKSL